MERKNIEDIQVGDKVLSKNEETGEVAYKGVTATFNHETDEIYKIYVGDQVIESTFNHPFYVKGKGWTFGQRSQGWRIACSERWEYTQDRQHQTGPKVRHGLQYDGL